MTGRRRDARPRVDWYRVTYQPRAQCEACSWTLTVDWFVTARQVRDRARSHAQHHLGHEVHVDVLDRATYVVRVESERGDAAASGDQEEATQDE